MGNAMGKKKRKASAAAKALMQGRPNENVVLTSSSYGSLQVELPKEIVDDLERPRGGPKGWGAGIVDPAHELYEKLKGLDQPAVMVPKPWSEVDQILSKLKPTAANASPRTPRLQSPALRAKQLLLEKPPSPPAIIDMSELMEGIDEGPRRSISKPDEPPIDPMEFIKTKPFNARKVKSLESTLSFSTIHTVRELDAGSSKSAGKPETVEELLRRKSPAHDMSSPVRLSNELSRRSSELTRRSSEIERRSTEIQRRSNDYQQRRSHDFQGRPSQLNRSSNYEQSTRPFSEISIARADSVRSVVSR